MLRLQPNHWINWRTISGRGVRSTAPFTGDDVNRLERPGGTRDWSRAGIEKRRKDLAEFEARWKKLDPTQWPTPQQVDYRSDRFRSRAGALGIGH